MAITRGATGNARPRIIETISTSPVIKKRRTNAAAKSKTGKDSISQTKSMKASSSSSSKRGRQPKASTVAGITKKAAKTATATANAKAKTEGAGAAK